MGMGAVVFAIGALFVVISGPFWATYLIYRGLVAKFACHNFKELPVTLFILSNILGYVWLVGTFVLFLTMIKIVVSAGRGGQDIVGICVLLSIPVGVIGWIVLAVQHFQRRAKYRIYAKLNPPPKLQIWLQDIMVGTFSLGLSMTVILNLRTKIADPKATVVLAVYEIVTQFVMFFALMDACRFSEKLQRPRLRALCVFGMLFINAFMPFPVLTALAWNVWRRALFLALTQGRMNSKKQKGGLV